MSRPDEELPLSRIKPVAEDVGRELDDHLARRTQDGNSIGDGEAITRAARAEAERAFGNLRDVARRNAGDITMRTRRRNRRVERLVGLLHDVRYGLRLLRRSPAPRGYWSF